MLEPPNQTAKQYQKQDSNPGSLNHEVSSFLLIKLGSTLYLQNT